MTNAPWSYSWRYGRPPRSAPEANPVARWYRYTCTRCDWRSDEVDKYRGPVAKSQAAFAALEDHLETHR
jgi:hypothetical protein